ncbi:hypothetical protein Molly5_199 [Maribacter phage Molly_5]|uniref:Uncharacterized protein n=1 Tax=Maribacter phage Molly_1 TaxID=2745685 RepID=A0A8E4UYB8_9CAUD|nr:hypothetical protein M1M29_gp199 [Maribacter phage Molly_1]QQO97698.1 hypothetical protein Molly2_199 [Maribacter phage Molly_2]QQO97898.1 hypothetical protein Molly3_199 [Maribacter phage Molly_3]QQO98098.1 hypothetical protein Molly4_199 [Maribacter phage Molly_4]QQO98298.1 hypothetical protein Molly5_199 [Maribacter phage Molly_5]QQO97498.1 hypothetical protein Molly1_199 [Maribacter phage Molly_1]
MLIASIAIVLGVLKTKYENKGIKFTSDEMLQAIGLSFLIGLWAAGLLMFLGLKINI